MRILLVGHGSFIARTVADVARSRCIPVAGIPHDYPLCDALRAGDSLINFALAPAYRSHPYEQNLDFDLKAANAARRMGAHMVMLSTRRIYPKERRWNAREAGPESGDETAYGHNKAISEMAVQEASEGTAGIFRMSNIFGYEYSSETSRTSFLAKLLTSLKRMNKIFFDMSVDTRRDFLPVEICASLLLDRALDRTQGTYNLGAGFPLACGKLANWVCQGYGGGELICDPDETRDEFFLNMDKWRESFPLPIDEQILRDYCIGLGRRLKCEKS